MKFAGTDCAVINRNGGTAGNVKFGIEANPKMFKLLSTGLYKYKIAAIIRELSCNAYDAHLMNGNPEQPFDIELPAYDNGFKFTIRDYGVGLSKIQIMGDPDNDIPGLYTNYGSSNKSHNNDCIGGMGLGSKSPLCFVNTFNVTSYYNGIKYIYNCGWDDAGLPECTFFGEVETDEPNGLEVSLVVKNTDIYTFNSAATTIFKYFDVPANFVGSQKPTIVHYKTEYSEDKIAGVDVYKNGTSISNLIMGQVSYPIDAEIFKSKENLNDDPWIREENKTTGRYRSVLNMGLAFEANIGDVEVDIGREGLQYTTEVKKYITDRLDVIIEAIRNEIEATISQAKNLWAAKIAYKNLVNNKYKQIKNVIESCDVKYNGLDVSDANTDIKDVLAKGTEVIHISNMGNKIKKSTGHTSIPHTETPIFINDVNVGQFAQVKRWMESKGVITAWIVKNNETEFLNTLGADSSDVIYISSLPKIPRNKGIVNKEFCFEFDMNRNQPYRSMRKSSRYFKEVSNDSAFDNCEVYFTISNFETHGSNPYRDVYELARLLRDIENTLGIKMPQIMAVKAANAEKVIKDKSFVHLNTYIKALVTDYIAEKDLEKVSADCQYHEQYNNNNFCRYILRKPALLSLLPTEHDIVKIAETSNELKNIHDKESGNISEIRDICKILSIDFSGKADYNLVTEIEELKKKYPILKLVQDSYSYDESIVASYINVQV